MQMVLKNFLQVYRVLYCRSALHMVGVGNQASSPSSKNTLRTICTSTKNVQTIPHAIIICCLSTLPPEEEVMMNASGGNVNEQGMVMLCGPVR